MAHPLAWATFNMNQTVRTGIHRQSTVSLKLQVGHIQFQGSKKPRPEWDCEIAILVPHSHQLSATEGALQSQGSQH